MILYKKEPIKNRLDNMIKLDIEGDGVVYISQTVYDQSLLLSDRFEGEKSVLSKLLNIGGNHKEQVEYFFQVMPEPLYILAPFIGLIEESIPLSNEIEQLCGVLHQISLAIDFNMFTKVPLEVRAEVRFSRRALFDYKRGWDDVTRQFDLCEIEDKIVDVAQKIISFIKEELPSINLQNQNSLATEQMVEEEEKEELLTLEELLALDEITEEDLQRAEPNALYEIMNYAEEEMEKEEQSKEAEELKTDKELSTIDKITAMYGGKIG